MKHLICLTIILCTMSLTAKAEPLLPIDKAAHFGLSFAAQTVAYGYLKEQDYDKIDALVISGASVFAIGLLWELVGSTGVSKNDILANTLGQAASTYTILKFDF